MEKIFTDVTDMIFERGALKFGAFKLKLHEKNPDAPLSPFYINLRDEHNPKPGPLVSADYNLIGRCMFQAIINFHRSGGDLVYDAIAGIPRAGDPIVQGMQWVVDMTDINQGDFRIIQLSKEEADGKRRIIPLPGFDYIEGERTLLADDLITQADTKLESIEAVESSGSKVVGLVVLVDRLQGGRERLETAGYKLISCFTIIELFDYYLATGKIDSDKYRECIDYIQNN